MGVLSGRSENYNFIANKKSRDVTFIGQSQTRRSWKLGNTIMNNQMRGNIAPSKFE